MKKFCVSLRRNSKDERVLFHYNGHGVPKPTNNGEIWVFNKVLTLFFFLLEVAFYVTLQNYTQYIPLSLYELQMWLGSPSIYVFDCSAAGLVLHWFNKFSEQREAEAEVC